MRGLFVGWKGVAAGGLAQCRLSGDAATPGLGSPPQLPQATRGGHGIVGREPRVVDADKGICLLAGTLARAVAWPGGKRTEEVEKENRSEKEKDRTKREGSGGVCPPERDGGMRHGGDSLELGSPAPGVWLLLRATAPETSALSRGSLHDRYLRQPPGR